MRQHTYDGMYLVHLVRRCLGALIGWDLYRLSMKELKAISKFFTTIQPALAKRVKEEGAEDPDIEDY